MATALGTGEARELFDGVRDYIKDAHEIMERGEFIELDGLDGRVAELCEAIVSMPQDQAADYATELEALMGELNVLKDMFEQGKASLAEELSGVNQHKQAASAYNTSTIMAAKTKPKGEDT